MSATQLQVCATILFRKSAASALHAEILSKLWFWEMLPYVFMREKCHVGWEYHILSRTRQRTIGVIEPNQWDLWGDTIKLQ